jgi:hypothetical protein
MSGWLFDPWADQLKQILRCSNGHFFLIEAKHKFLIYGLPKAVGQAIIWANVTGFVVSKSFL